MGKSNRAYKSAKRNKELDRLKKREEKRLKREKTKESQDGDNQPGETVNLPGDEDLEK